MNNKLQNLMHMHIQLSESKLSRVATLEDVLQGHVVKCVRIRQCAGAASADSPIIACGGNSHTVRILDARQGAKVSSARIHTRARAHTHTLRYRTIA